MDNFRHVTTWVFDLDNTLYPPQMQLFAQIEPRMTAWIMRELGVDRAKAETLRQRYWSDYGTTLAGLMRHHGTDPDGFVNEVHEIDLSGLAKAPDLADAVSALPGRKIVFTNGPRAYAARVLAALGLTGLWDAVYGAEDAGFQPKPHPEAFSAVFGSDGLDPRRAAMFEDDARNLAVPHALGLRTVHVAGAPQPEPHIHHHTDDLTGFLGGVTRALAKASKSATV